ncbi:MAG: HAD-IIIC family phosphatase [Oscillospiraceae bacterium]|nr:HAD-IIIC family phosphatase [Oscillospiraceae bacterium]
MDFSSVKLIIWDLDETLWKGTISDNDTVCLRKELVAFIHSSLDRGIVHSICSKNDYDDTKSFLITQGLWDLFVFPSINWEPKGNRVKGILEEMKLRPQNTLFVDDNLSNLQEAVYCCPELQVCTPEELSQSVGNILSITKIDTGRPRLAQYKLLEKKNISEKAYSSNEDFLMSCNIRVDIQYDCTEQIDRIHDLIMRSNQLNYTKFRQSKEALIEQLSKQETQAAYITVRDNFGDYGIVGFYMMVHGELVHYLFSCRTLGMLVEQYVYVKIGCPALNTVGDVITKLNTQDIPQWINQSGAAAADQNTKLRTGNRRILFKGPCDISQIFSFIEETDCIATEFTYVNDTGISVEGHNHTSQMVTALTAGDADKAKVIADTQWIDDEMLSHLGWKNNDAIVFSMLTDGNLGIYQHIKTGLQIALCEKYYDLTNPENWESYIQGTIFTSFINFTEDALKDFSEKYRFVDNSDGEITISNLDVLYQVLAKGTKLILLLGSERPFEGCINCAYQDRQVFHKLLNDKIKAWAKDKENVYLIEISKHIHSQKDYTDTINHFQKKVYFHIAQELSSILNSHEATIKIKSRLYLQFVTVVVKLKKIIKRILRR